MKRILLSIGVALSATAAMAQFTVDAEIRPRVEMRNGYKGSLTDADKPSLFTSQRSRVNFGYKKDKIQLGVSLQDVRIWGQEKNSTFNDTLAASVVHEAWAGYAVCRNSFLKIGRQEVGIEDERLLTKGGWNQQGQSLDGVLFTYDSLFQFQAFASLNKNYVVSKNYPTEPSVYGAYSINDKTFDYIVLKKKFGSVTIAGVSIAKGTQKTAAFNTLCFKFTNGGYLYYDNDSAKFHAKAFGFYQGGKDAAAKEAKAYLCGASVWKEIGIYTPTLGCDVMSGNKLTTKNADENTEENQFDYAPGSAHSYYGIIDYFPGTLGKKTGFINPYLKNKVKINNKFTAGVDFLYFMSPNDYYNADGTAMSKQLGIETDVILTYTVSKEFNMQLGYSAIKASETLRAMQGKDKKELGQWAWLMLTFKPQLFKHDWK